MSRIIFCLISISFCFNFLVSQTDSSIAIYAPREAFSLPTIEEILKENIRHKNSIAPYFKSVYNFNDLFEAKVNEEELSEIVQEFSTSNLPLRYNEKEKSLRESFADSLRKYDFFIQIDIKEKGHFLEYQFILYPIVKDSSKANKQSNIFNINKKAVTTVIIDNEITANQLKFLIKNALLRLCRKSGLHVLHHSPDAFIDIDKTRLNGTIGPRTQTRLTAYMGKGDTLLVDGLKSKDYDTKRNLLDFSWTIENDNTTSPDFQVKIIPDKTYCQIIPEDTGKYLIRLGVDDGVLMKEDNLAFDTLYLFVREKPDLNIYPNKISSFNINSHNDETSQRKYIYDELIEINTKGIIDSTYVLPDTNKNMYKLVYSNEPSLGELTIKSFGENKVKTTKSIQLRHRTFKPITGDYQYLFNSLQDSANKIHNYFEHKISVNYFFFRQGIWGLNVGFGVPFGRLQWRDSLQQITHEFISWADLEIEGTVGNRNSRYISLGLNTRLGQIEEYVNSFDSYYLGLFRVKAQANFVFLNGALELFALIKFNPIFQRPMKTSFIQEFRQYGVGLKFHIPNRIDPRTKN